MNLKTAERRSDIDWIRVLATVAVLFFHCARFFNDEDWHVKNGLLSEGMSAFVWFTSRWMMPLFFLLSAFSNYFSLQHRPVKKYLKERVLRLLVPFVFGTLVLIPPQVYIERLTHGQFSGSFIEFLPKYFQGFYGFGGNFAWMGLHLWYLEALFLFSLITLPLFLWLCREPQPEKPSHLTTVLTKPGGIYLVVLPVWLIEIFSNANRDGIGRRDFGGWALLTYLVVFVIGFLLARGGKVIRDVIARYRFFSLAIGIVAIITGYLIDPPISITALSLIRACMMIFCLLAIMGFGIKHLSFEKPFLKHANEAVLPFYILHQTIIVILAFFLITWNTSVFLKYVVLLSTSFISILLIYWLIVRRSRLFRFLFGMKATNPTPKS